MKKFSIFALLAAVAIFAASFLIVGCDGGDGSDGNNNDNDSATMIDEEKACAKIFECRSEIVTELDTMSNGNGEIAFDEMFGTTVSECVEFINETEDGGTQEEMSDECIGCFDVDCADIVTCMTTNCMQ